MPGDVSAEVAVDVVRDGVARVEESAAHLAAKPKDADALHDHRKACRVLDARLDLLHFALTPTALAHAHAIASALPRGLGKHRDADVARARRDELGDDITPRSPKHRRRDVERALERARPRRLREPIEAVLGEAPADARGDATALLAARVRLRLARAVATGRLADVHALRLDAKALRFGLDAIGDEAAERDAGNLVDLLGEATDAALLADAAERAEDAPPAKVALLRVQRDAEVDRVHATLAQRIEARAWPALLAVVEHGVAR